MKQWVWLVLATFMVAGCTDNSDEAGPKCDLEANYEDVETGECLPHVEPSIIVEGLPAQLQQYTPATFSWSLDPGTRAMDGSTVHSMDSRIKIGNEGTVLTNVTGPDEWGQDLVREQHKDLPQNFTAKLSWDVAETLYVKGYMLIDAVNLWYDLGTVQITPVVATNNYTTITISGPQPALSSDKATVTVGDGVTFTNNHEFLAYTLSFEGNDCPSGGNIATGASLSVDFLSPGPCDFDLKTQGSGSGATQGDLDGRITVARPA